MIETMIPPAKMLPNSRSASDDGPREVQRDELDRGQRHVGLGQVAEVPRTPLARIPATFTQMITSSISG